MNKESNIVSYNVRYDWSIVLYWAVIWLQNTRSKNNRLYKSISQHHDDELKYFSMLMTGRAFRYTRHCNEQHD